jgi:hypothetical protein
VLPPLWRDASTASSQSRCCESPPPPAALKARRARFADEAAFRAALKLPTAEAALYVEWALA